MAAAASGDAPFNAAKIATARFHAEHMLSQVPAQGDAIIEGGGSVLALPLDAF